LYCAVVIATDKRDGYITLLELGNDGYGIRAQGII
jgi:hypothetical protein